MRGASPNVSGQSELGRSLGHVIIFFALVAATNLVSLSFRYCTQLYPSCQLNEPWASVTTFTYWPMEDESDTLRVTGEVTTLATCS
ncbi:hypothetical protein PROFUN_01172 [Planoprotostelium fungivorum]|uniref:Uncharacterized protein n=1 Tax=Planoprotostelium fungivorum TaxID=1890364 RepID=A0A2P6NCJ8_9EUKA|nr:hypothetical protein PROFUN_01172 [Planoprotostelium fungivorum]